MVFSTTTLFKSIACPEGSQCSLTNCVYGHDFHSSTQRPAAPTAVMNATAKPPPQPEGDELAEPASKRRKFTHGALADQPPSGADIVRGQIATAKKPPPLQDSISEWQSPKPKSQPPASLVKPVTPAPANGNAASISGPKVSASSASRTDQVAKQIETPKSEKIETLNPRLITNDPAGHAKRQLYLKNLHAEMVRLNTILSEAPGLDQKQKRLLQLTDQEIITFALDGEERMARDNPNVYANVVKQRIAALRKMSLDDWVKEIKISFGKGQSETPKKVDKVIETGLLLSQEVLILPQLVADQKPLAGHGYIPVPPTPEQAVEAATAVEASQNWEVCDRCAGRFQVFPDRNEHGLLTGNGPCRFHPNRKVYPPRAKTDKETGGKEPFYPCCNELVGAPGCATHTEHVFKTSSPARLASILPFETTPENPSPRKDPRGRKIQAVTFDCEMGYTAKGMELIRLTAVSWPYNEDLVDVLVRPLGAVIDLNSRFSGIFPEDYTRAIPYDKWASQVSPPPVEDERPRLPLVESPQKARELLCSFLTPQTPLMGHAIDNDLNTVRLCHPTIIDTVLLFPHPRGLPMRLGLRMLAGRHLNRRIQEGGALGHDSREDAVATGDLIRVKVAQKWKEMRLTGWQIVDGDRLMPPPPRPSDLVKSEAAVQDHAKRAVEGAGNGCLKRKKRPSADGADGDSGSNEDGPAPANGDT